ncbi:ubiquitin-conjugating enzyme (huntingtin interacting protein 2) [Entomortierella parvispora]|uniref:Ubiquitin-conjugating enzyme E2 1 n=1 Tax=Entomortierella parvispora TaxID=205924 RepID=A0A9P3LYQ6_9FUNG|nr:ubiquitin-conjugating enzyme (huntingtin interacting protein 2) [Entomortierella parvispora]
MTQRLRRIQKEITECQRDQASLIQLTLVDEGNMMHLKGRFPGPPDTPYEGGMYQVDVELPDAYPFQPPKVKFETKIYHPNISSQTGAICLDILKQHWSPVMTLSSTLLSVQSMLCTPEPTDPQDAQVASQYLNNYDAFVETAKFWTECYAKPKPGDSTHASSIGHGGANGQDNYQHQPTAPVRPVEPVLSQEEQIKRSKVQDLVEMGFAADRARTYLIRANWKQDVALEELLNDA